MLDQINHRLRHLPWCQHPKWCYFQKISEDRGGALGHAEVWGKSVDVGVFGEDSRVAEEMVGKKM